MASLVDEVSPTIPRRGRSVSAVGFASLLLLEAIQLVQAVSNLKAEGAGRHWWSSPGDAVEPFTVARLGAIQEGGEDLSRLRNCQGQAQFQAPCSAPIGSRVLLDDGR